MRALIGLTLLAMVSTAGLAQTGAPDAPKETPSSSESSSSSSSSGVGIGVDVGSLVKGLVKSIRKPPPKPAAPTAPAIEPVQTAAGSVPAATEPPEPVAAAIGSPASAAVPPPAAIVPATVVAQPQPRLKAPPPPPPPRMPALDESSQAPSPVVERNETPALGLPPEPAVATAVISASPVVEQVPAAKPLMRRNGVLMRDVWMLLLLVGAVGAAAWIGRGRRLVSRTRAALAVSSRLETGAGAFRSSPLQFAGPRLSIRTRLEPGPQHG